MLFVFVGVDQNIQITLEMIREEQLGIITISYFKCIPDFILFVTVNEIYKWLSPPKESVNCNSVCGTMKSQPGTCQWFLNGKTFSGWLQQPGFL